MLHLIQNMLHKSSSVNDVAFNFQELIVMETLSRISALRMYVFFLGGKKKVNGVLKLIQTTTVKCMNRCV